MEQRAPVPSLDADGRWLAQTTQETWAALCPDADPRHVAVIAEALAGDYAEPHRRWHTAYHVRDMHGALAGLLEEAAMGAWTTLLARAACLYHDRVYRPGAADNEHASAELARADAATLGLPDGDTDVVARLILVTERHDPAGVPWPDAEVERAAALLCDADMAVLGAEPSRYERYRAAVREEYGALPEEHWRAGRAAFLASTLEAPRIFHTERAHERWDAPARGNLEAELAALTAEG